MSDLKALAGWLPAVILPLAAANQWYTALNADDLSGVSALAWTLFLVANLGSLAFAPTDDTTKKLQVWIAFGLTSLLEIGIIATVLFRDV